MHRRAGAPGMPRPALDHPQVGASCRQTRRDRKRVSRTSPRHPMLVAPVLDEDVELDLRREGRERRQDPRAPAARLSPASAIESRPTLGSSPTRGRASTHPCRARPPAWSRRPGPIARSAFRPRAPPQALFSLAEDVTAARRSLVALGGGHEAVMVVPRCAQPKACEADRHPWTISDAVMEAQRGRWTRSAPRMTR